jgi:hypothetical protein
MTTETLQNGEAISRLHELKLQGHQVRSMTQGRTLSEWVIEWDENPQVQDEIKFDDGQSKC